MSGGNFQEDTYINSIIGEGTRLKGEFELNGLLRIDGDFVGVVKTTGKVLVGSNGRAECTIYGGTVVIGGAVKGNIFATEKVIILSTGIMIGNIKAPRLIMEEGVLFNGTCRIEPVVSKEKANKFHNNDLKSGKAEEENTPLIVRDDEKIVRKSARVAEKRAF